METYFYFLPFLAILIHNIEEALWLPQWSKYAKKFHKEVKSYEFHFAVLIVTALALIITFGMVIYHENLIVKFIYFGFFGMMIMNVFFPHLTATIVLKKYTPGLITGLLLNIPINLIVIIKAINCNVISIVQAVIATVVVGVLIILSLPLLFKLGTLVKDYSICDE